MKKFLFVLILTLGWLVSKGQLYPPIQPYLENDYSISQVKRFAMGQNELSSSWRKEFLSIVNDGLAQAGENMYLGEDKILSALDHVVYERRNLNYSFENSRNISNQVKFYSDFGFDGMVGVFKYGKCSLVIFKTRCMNLLKCRLDVVQIEIKPEPKPDPAPDWRTYQAPKKVYPSNPQPIPVVVPVVFKKAFFQRTGVQIGCVTIGLGGIVAGVLLSKHHRSSGVPGGAPKTPPEPIVPPVIPPVIPGGPGGAPLTK
ncbi:MAG: hypothetical protein NTV03_03920 [Candidatus Nomurabacteria bacterium]|nr:hypothetical protein [Candidatus Nomurabacteria bacterium]